MYEERREEEVGDGGPCSCGGRDGTGQTGVTTPEGGDTGQIESTKHSSSSFSRFASGLVTADYPY